MRVPADPILSDPSPDGGRSQGRPAAPGFDAALAAAGRGAGGSPAADPSGSAPVSGTAGPAGPGGAELSLPNRGIPAGAGTRTAVAVTLPLDVVANPAAPKGRAIPPDPLPAPGTAAQGHAGTLPAPTTPDEPRHPLGAKAASALPSLSTRAATPPGTPPLTGKAAGGDSASDEASESGARSEAPAPATGGAPAHEPARLATPLPPGAVLPMTSSADRPAAGRETGTPTAPAGATGAGSVPVPAADPPPPDGTAATAPRAAIAAMVAVQAMPRGSGAPEPSSGAPEREQHLSWPVVAPPDGGDDALPNARAARAELALADRLAATSGGEYQAVVTRRETHFAPVAPREAAVQGQPGGAGVLASQSVPPPIRTEPLAVAPQAAATPASSAPPALPPVRIDAPAVVAQVIQALATRGDGGGAAPEPSVSAPAVQSTQAGAVAATAGPVRIVEMQLQPAALGALTVTMRISPAGLKVTMAANSRETAQLLQENRSELTELIRRAGYTDADVSVEHTAASNADGGGSGANQDRPDGRRPSGEPPGLPAPSTPTDPRLHRSITV